MMPFDLFVDSAANLPDDLVAQNGIRVIPYTYLVNGSERFAYSDGVPFSESAAAFYAEMRAGADIKTSLIPTERFKEAWLPSLEAGRDVFTVTITASLSGTNAQALAAAKELSARYPDRKIVVADSCNASLGEGLLALRVCALRDMGESIETCARWFEENRYKLNSQVTVNDLKFLHRSGRVSGIVAFAGNLLGLKPMLRADGSSPARLVVYAKQKGRKKSLSEILRAFDENVVDPASQTVAIAHADCREDADAIADALRERGVRDIIIEYYDLCTGSHVGPGTLALFYFGKDRRGTKSPAPSGVAVKKPAPAKL